LDFFEDKAILDSFAIEERLVLSYDFKPVLHDCLHAVLSNSIKSVTHDGDQHVQENNLH